MMGEWQEMPFSEAVEVNPRVDLKRGTAYPFVDMAAVNPTSSEVSAIEERRFNGGGSRFAAGDTLMARITPCLENGKITRFFGKDGTVGHGSTEFIVIRGRKGVSDTAFAYYLTRWNGVREYAISQMTGTSGRQRVPTEALDYVKVRVPPLPEQRIIAHILGTLDDKIELNRRINETLGTIAQTLFKSWFVDATQDGLPNGWHEESIYAAAEVMYGAPFSSAKFNTDGIGKPLIRIRDLANESPEVFTSEEHPKGYLVKPGEIIVGMDGEFRAYLWGGEESWLNQRVCVFIPKLGFSAPFVLNSIARPLAEVEATETATTVIHLGKNDIDRFKIIVPTKKILAKFNRTAEPLFKRIVVNKQESRTLAALRDVLLPRLISGELRVYQNKQPRITVTTLKPKKMGGHSGKATDEFIEAILLSRIVQRAATPQYPVGRMRYSKLSYFAHRKANEDVQAHYQKMPAGPYSPWARYSGPEKIAQKNGYVKQVRTDTATGWISGNRINEIDHYALRYPAAAAVDWVLGWLRYKKKEELELLATVDFASLDLIQQGNSATVKDIKQIIANHGNWAPKLSRAVFSDANIERALMELKQHFPNTYQ